MICHLLALFNLSTWQEALVQFCRAVPGARRRSGERVALNSRHLVASGAGQEAAGDRRQVRWEEGRQDTAAQTGQARPLWILDRILKINK